MFENIKDFYPTPSHLIHKMLNGIDFTLINTVLEPSGGKGDLLDAVKDKLKYSRNNFNYNREQKFDIDTIEINENLQHILRGKNYRVVHDDFLTYQSYKKYDLIVANFPFSDGGKHLLKAIEMQQNGGTIVCLLNAETLKNPYSNNRKDLIQKLEQYNANIEYISNAFYDAERKTGVEIALIKINIPKSDNNSIILDEMKKEEQHKAETIYSNNNLINADFLKGIVEQYNFEVKAGLKLIAEYNALKPLLLNSIKKDTYGSEILELKLKYADSECTIENGYIKQVRMKYWEALFESKQFTELFTSNLIQKYYNKINELKDYDFSLYNIYTIRIQLNKDMLQGVEDTILNLFEELSHKHYYDECSKNIHYYNGWKTNKAYKINKKVIIPLNGFQNMQYSWGGYRPTQYKIVEKLADIEKVFNYLDGCKTEDINLKDALKFAEGYGETSKILTKYFWITFYKKGTCHIEFRNLDLLQKFNLYGSQRLGWLPPSYGKAKYSDMTADEKSVIDKFEGKESYNRVMDNKDYFIVETSKLLRLTS
jgi:hypothetical protein